MKRIPSYIVGIIVLDNSSNPFYNQNDRYGTALVRFSMPNASSSWPLSCQTCIKADTNQLQDDLDLAYAELVDQMR